MLTRRLYSLTVYFGLHDLWRYPGLRKYAHSCAPIFMIGGEPTVHEPVLTPNVREGIVGVAE